MVSRIRPMQIERGKFANEMVRSFPNLNMCAMCHSNIPVDICQRLRPNIKDGTYSPSGENCISLTGF